MRNLLFGILVCAAVIGPFTASAQSDQHPYRKQIEEMDRQLSSVRFISETDLSADGSRVVWSVDGPKPGTAVINMAAARSAGSPKRITAGTGGTFCEERAPVWAQDGNRLAFLSDCNTPGQLQLFTVDIRTDQPARQLTRLAGFLSRPRWSPDGKEIAFLFVDHATRRPSPMAAIGTRTGVIDEQPNTDVQRIAVTDLTTGQTRQMTPAGLNVYEFDWSPDGRKLAFTAAPPPGDDNWYIAQLYTQAVTDSKADSIYKPKWQIAVPRWSPDGNSIAFIEGLMSDEGGTGGEIYLLPSKGGQPRDLTPGRHSTPSWFTWISNGSLLFTEFVGGSSAISRLEVPSGKTTRLWEGGETIDAGPEATSLSIAKAQAGRAASAPEMALIRWSWSALPEVWAGTIGAWRQISYENSGFTPKPARAESISWTNDSFHAQGWLLFPQNFDPAKKYPMIVSVHGGPAWIFTPRWASPDLDLTAFADLGYFIFFPNPRGSYGEGEKFTQANRRDWGFGDLRDILTGVDAIAAKFPVDPQRVGIAGWSYGGSTAMFAVTQTNRFRAAVAGASASDWLSYYGENSIDQWMIPYFGKSAYDDPAAYLRSSAITYVKQAKTPTLILVGERDGEAPPAQSFEFWHALKTFDVPTELVVYAGEGHSFSKHEDRVDRIERTLEWFMRYMPGGQASSRP